MTPSYRNLRRSLTLVGALGTAIPPITLAQGTLASAEPVMAPVVTHHTITFGRRSIAYTTTVGERVLTDSGGLPLATMFATTYLRAGVTDPSARPVLFAFNGGPGASSSPLHFGALGPIRRLQELDAAGARRMAVNVYSVLDVADLVFIDPVGTGFARVLSDGDGSPFWSVEGDAGATRTFILDWLRDHKRESSPLFICGESYGGFRIATMMEHTGGLKVAGVILVSPMLDASGSSETVGNDLPYIFALPSMAAAAWYHARIDRGGRSVVDVFEEAAAFAQGDYALALLKGSRLPSADRDRIATRMVDLIGVPAAAIAATSLRVESEQFLTSLLEDHGLRIGRLDARATGDATELAAKRPPLNDPSMTLSGADNSINTYFHRELGVTTAREYVTLALDVNGRWNWRGDGRRDPFYRNPTPNIAAAMAAQPTLRVLLAGGLFDLATPYLAGRYALDHGGLPPDRVTIAAFPGGHSFYDDEENLAQFATVLRRFIAGG